MLAITKRIPLQAVRLLSERISPYVTTAVCRAGTQAATFVSMLFAIRALKAEVFGAFTLAWSVTVIGNGLIYSGFFQYILRVREIDVAKHTVFWLLLFEGALISLGMVVAGLWIGWAGNASVSTCFLVLAPVPTAITIAAWGDALLTRAHRVASVSVVWFLAEVAGTLALLAGLQLGWTIAALLGWRVVSSFSGLLGLAVLTGELPRARWSGSVRKEAIQQALPLQGNSVLLTASNYAADFLLAGYLSTAASGAYRVASRIATTGGGVFLEPLRPLTWGAMAEHERSDSLAGMRRTYFEQFRLVSFFAWPILLSLSLFSGRLFSAIAREDWSNAAPVLMLLAISRLADVPIFFLDPVLVCTGRTGLQFRVRTASTILFLCGLAVTAAYSAIVVARWQVLYAALVCVVSVELACRSLEMPRRAVLRAALPALLTAAACMAAGELTYRVCSLPSVSRLVLSIAAMGLTLGASFLLLHRRGTLRFPKR